MAKTSSKVFDHPITGKEALRKQRQILDELCRDYNVTFMSGEPCFSPEATEEDRKMTFVTVSRHIQKQNAFNNYIIGCLYNMAPRKKEWVVAAMGSSEQYNLYKNYGSIAAKWSPDEIALGLPWTAYNLLRNTTGEERLKYLREWIAKKWNTRSLTAHLSQQAHYYHEPERLTKYCHAKIGRIGKIGKKLIPESTIALKQVARSLDEIEASLLSTLVSQEE